MWKSRKSISYYKVSSYEFDNTLSSNLVFTYNKSYKEYLLKTVNLAGDTDTVAAVAGGLTGIYYGMKVFQKNGLEL